MPGQARADDMLDIVPFILAAVVGMAGAYLVRESLRRDPAGPAMRRLVRRRRRAQGVVFLLISACGFSLALGGLIPRPRAIVIVCPAVSAGAETTLANDLKELLARLHTWDRVNLVRLSEDGPRAAFATGWSWRASLPGTSDGIVSWLNGARAIPPPAPSAGAGSGGPAWGAVLARTLAEQGDQHLAGLEKLFRPTALIVWQDARPWDQLSVADVGPLESALGARDRDQQAFVFESPSSRPPGSLRIRTEPDVLPEGSPVNLGGARVMFELVDCPIRQAGARYSVLVSIDGKPSPAQVLADDDPGRSQVGVGLTAADLYWPDNRVAPMLHEIQVALTIPASTATGPATTYRARTYVRVTQSSVAIFEPKADSRTRASAWPLFVKDVDVTGQALLKSFLISKGEVNTIWSSIGPAQLKEVTNWQDMTPEALKPVLDSIATLVLIEPTLDDFKKLAISGISNQIRQGLTVFVVAPPTVDPTAVPPDWPEWLPAGTMRHPAVATRPAVVWRDRRVYIAPDTSRVSLLSPEAAVPLQVSFINKVVSSLSGGTVGEAVIAKTGIEERPVVVPSPASMPRGFWVDPQSVAPLIIIPALGLSEAKTNEQLSTMYSKPDGSAGYEGFNLESALTNLTVRLSTLSKQNARPLELDAPHPGTSIVLIAVNHALPKDDLARAQMPLIAFAAAQTGVIPAAVAGSPLTIEQCAALGIQVIPVLIEPGPDRATTVARWIKGAGGGVAGETVRELVEELRRTPAIKAVLADPISFSDPSAAEKVSNLIREWNGGVTGRSFAATPAGAAGVLPAGEVIDPRFDGSSTWPAAPWRHELLTRLPDGTPNAFVADVNLSVTEPRAIQMGTIALAANAATPLVVSRRWYAGSVIVSGYSIFSAEVWRASVGRALGEISPSLPPVPPLATADVRRVDNASAGVGVQRLLDTLDLRRFAQPVVPGRLTINEVSVLDDNATLRLDAWFDPTSPVPRPRLLDNHGAELGAWTMRQEPADGVVRYECRVATETRDVPATLALGDGVDGRSRTGIYLNLRAAGAAGQNVKEALVHYSMATGGTVVRATEEAAPLLEAGQPAAWAARIALAVLMLTLFSPLIRPWRAWRDRAMPNHEPDASKMRVYDVEGILNEFGMNPGRPRTRKLAGLPAGQKFYESGDSLQSALPATLIGFTQVGEDIGLPARRPVVRLRQRPSAMEMVLCVDASPGLFLERLPDLPAKREMLSAALQLLAGTALRTGGSVVLLCLQAPDQEVRLNGASGSREEFSRFLTFCEGRSAATPGGPGPRLPTDALNPGHVCCIVSDALNWSVKQVRKAIDDARLAGVELRLVQLCAPGDEQFLGVQSSAISGELLDRTEWEENDIIAGQRKIAQAIGGTIADARFATLDADMSASDMLERLIETGVAL